MSQKFSGSLSWADYHKVKIKLREVRRKHNKMAALLRYYRIKCDSMSEQIDHLSNESNRLRYDVYKLKSSIKLKLYVRDHEKKLEKKNQFRSPGEDNHRDENNL